MSSAKFSFGRALMAVAGLAIVAAPAAGAAPGTAWPRTFESGGAHVVVYQPQVRDWPSYTVLDGVAAAAVTLGGSSTAIYGVVTFHALTSANFQTGVVSLSNPAVTSTNWPNESAATSAQLDAIVKAIPLSGTSVPVAAVLASLGASKALPKNVPVQTNPPVIYASQKPSILVVFDRPPILAPIEKTGLKFAVNTNWTVIFDDGDKKFYLLATDHWISATSITGPWAPAVAPAGFAALPDDANWTEARAHLHAAALSAAAMPKVFVSTVPADLIAIAGAPKLVPIPPTQLQYVSNTGSSLFLYTPSHAWYVLLSGRWYRSGSLDGPWTYASTSLPADFARIPENSARGSVLVSVPGTPAAQYAGASAQVPKIAAVNPATTTLTVSYAGDPEFRPVAGTTLSYAINTAYDVIRTQDGQYFACYSGVWFTASDPKGPWTVAGWVPKAIYSIPVSSQLYSDTYVYVYSAGGQPVYVPPATPPATVYVGYTAGYVGGFWAGGAWVYGTGYYWPGYYAPGAFPVYYPYGATWTGGSYYTGGSYNSYYNARTGYYGNQASVYGPYGGATAKSAYNPATGTYARGGAVYGPNGEAAAGSFYNPRYGVGGTTEQEKTPYGSWGSSQVTTKAGTTYAGHQTGSNGEAAGMTGPHGSTAVAKSSSTGDVYAGHDGNVYKNTGTGWQKSTGNGSWSSVSPPTQSHSSSSGGAYSGGDYHSSGSGAYSSGDYHSAGSTSGSTYGGLNSDAAARGSGDSGFHGFSGGGGYGGGESGGYHGGGGGFGGGGDFGGGGRR